MRWTRKIGSSTDLVKGTENRRGQQGHQGLTGMRPIGAILTYGYILGLFRIITKSAEEPISRVHLNFREVKLMGQSREVDPEWTELSDALFQEAYPRREVFGFLVLTILFAFTVSTVTEFLLAWKGVNTEGLGVFVMGGMAALLLNALVKLHIILGWIDSLPTEVMTKSNRESALEYLATLEAASNSSNKTFEPHIKVLGVILLAGTYILSSNEPQLAKALTLSFVEDHPIVMAAVSVAIGTFFTNHRNVWYMMGDAGRFRRTFLFFGKIRLGMVLGAIGSGLTTIACVIWASWLIG